MQFDLISFLIGFASASLIAFILYRQRARISAVRAGVEQQAGAARQFLANTAEGRYYKGLSAHLNSCHLAGELVTLSEIYVEPRFVLPAAPIDPTDDKPPTVFHVVPQFHDMPASYAPYNVPALTVNDLRIGERNIALLGAPGSGKSTALAIIGLVAAGEIELPTIDVMADPVFEEEIKNLPPDERERQIKQREELQKRALDQLRRSQSSAEEEAVEKAGVDFKTLLPIFIHLREIDLRPESYGVQDTAKAKALDPAEPLVKALQARFGGITASVLPRLIYERLTAGTALVLIDGYDDLPPGQRPEKLRWLSSFVEIYRANFIILAGPESGYGPLVELGLNPCFLRAWSDADYDTLVQRWTLAWMQVARERRTPMPDEKLVRRVAANNRGRTPLDVTLKAWAAFAGDEQELGRRGWYDSYLRQQLKDHRPVLEKIAAAILDKDGLPLTREQMKEVAAPLLAGGNVDDAINKLINSPLLVEWVNGAYGLNHAVICGYLAAETLTESTLAEAANKPAWANAMPFAAIRLPMDAVVTARLSATPDLLYSGLFSIVPWLLDSPTSAPWRAEIFRRLAAALIAPSQFPHIRERAMAAMVASRDKGVIFVLRQALQSPNPAIRRLGCIGLGALGETDAIKDLAPMLADADPDVQLAAALGLAAIGSETALETMLQALFEGEPSLRRAVAEALAAIPGVGHLTLREAVVSSDMMMRYAAVFGLARVKAGWAVSLLHRTILEDEQWYVRNAAEQAFREMERPEQGGIARHPDADKLTWLISWAAERGEGVPAGPNSRQMLIRVLQEGEPPLRAAAAKTLANLGHVPALKPLYSALRDREETVRAAVYESLGALQNQSGLPLPSVN